MSARGELRAFAESVSGASAAQAFGPAWRVRHLDAVRARRAAVLILFGVLDDLPAEFHTEAVPDDLDVLLVQRADTLNDHPGQVAFPGGGIDAGDEDAVAAALREAHEETGLVTGGVEVLGVLPEVGLPVSNFMVTPVLGWWLSPSPVAVVDVGESAHVFRAGVADLLNPKNRRTVVVHRGGSTRRTPAFLVNGVTVWGFTAMLLDGMFNQLGWTVPWDATREIPAPL